MSKKTKKTPIENFFEQALKDSDLTIYELLVLIAPPALQDPLVSHNLLLDLTKKGYFIMIDQEHEFDKTFERTPKAIELIEKIEKLFKPIKGASKLEIPEERVQEYVELFPNIKLPSDKYARVNVKSLISVFQWFFKTYPEYSNWTIIYKVTERYLKEKEAANWLYCRTSQYFIRRMNPDKSWGSDLADLYQRELNGTHSEEDFKENNFKEKVV